VDGCVRDVRIALRGLRRSPGFAVTAILMLAVGIGAVTMILFGVSPGDPWILASSGILLPGVAVIAMTRPVTRACRINPLEALRQE
jgi:hypothetical protein